MKFDKIPETTFKQLQLNAGILLRRFDPATATVLNSDIVGATTGGITFSAVPTFSDFGEDIDNCPKNMKELKKLGVWDVSLSGTFVTIDPASAKDLVGAGDVDGERILPRNDVLGEDFADIWWVGDYSDENGKTNGGFVAIHMMNSLSTGGLSIKSSDGGKGNFAFTYTAHYSMDAQETVPFEVYVRTGTAEPEEEPEQTTYSVSVTDVVNAGGTDVSLSVSPEFLGAEGGSVTVTGIIASAVEAEISVELSGDGVEEPVVLTIAAGETSGSAEFVVGALSAEYTITATAVESGE